MFTELYLFLQTILYLVFSLWLINIFVNVVLYGPYMCIYNFCLLFINQIVLKSYWTFALQLSLST